VSFLTKQDLQDQISHYEVEITEMTQQAKAIASEANSKINQLVQEQEKRQNNLSLLKGLLDIVNKR
jgi:F0F1-type ATP synthase membrane subunit b/b'